MSEQTINVGDRAYLAGDTDDIGVVERVAGPVVDVQWVWPELEQSEYYAFRCYGFTWDGEQEAWRIAHGSIL